MVIHARLKILQGSNSPPQCPILIIFIDTKDQDHSIVSKFIIYPICHPNDTGCYDHSLGVSIRNIQGQSASTGLSLPEEQDW